VNEEHLLVAPVETEDATGGKEPIHPEILGEHPDNAAMGKEQMSSGLETLDEIAHPVVELEVGLAARGGKSTEGSKYLAVVGVGFVVGTAFDIAEVTLAQPDIATRLAPRTSRRSAAWRRPMAVSGGSLQPATLFVAEKVVSPWRTSQSSRVVFMASKNSAERNFEFRIFGSASGNGPRSPEVPGIPT